MMPIIAELSLELSEQLEWFVYGFSAGSVPCAVALAVKFFKSSAGDHHDL